MINLEKDLVRFEIDTKKHNIQDILKHIISNSIDFTDMHIRRPTLDDFFIKLARSGK
jgi:hypothetical protein